MKILNPTVHGVIDYDCKPVGLMRDFASLGSTNEYIGLARLTPNESAFSLKNARGKCRVTLVVREAAGDETLLLELTGSIDDEPPTLLGNHALTRVTGAEFTERFRAVFSGVARPPDFDFTHEYFCRRVFSDYCTPTLDGAE